MSFSERRTLPLSESNFKVEWAECLKLAKAGACDGVNAWFAGSQVRGGRVEGAVGHLTPGSLQSNGFFRQMMWTTMTRGGAPELVAAAFSDTVSGFWKAWFDGYEIELEYSSLAEVEGSVAGPVANKPVMFSKGKSSAESLLSSEQLTAGIEHALTSVAFQAGAHETCFWFSEWLTQLFDQWRSKVLLMNVLGSGPVPSFSPPTVTSGPVVGGTLSSRRPLLPDHGVFRLPR